MPYRINPLVKAVRMTPIATIREAAEAGDFPPDKPLLDVGPGEPDYPPAAALNDHLAAIIARPETARYTGIMGIAPLRAALAATTRRLYGGDLKGDQVAITAGCNQAFCMAMMALAGAGDEVILPVPYYFNHPMWLELLGVRPVTFPARLDRGGLPEVADAEVLIGDRTRAIVLVAPNNPTGAIYPPALIDAFFALAQRHRIALVIDETYRDFLPPGDVPHGLFRRADWAETFVHLYSFSKVYALTGYRVGAVAAGPALLDAMAKALDCVSISTSRIAQEGALYGLLHLDDWRAEKRTLIRDRTEALRAAFRRNDLAYELINAGPFFAYARHPFAGVPALEVARRLAREQNLLTMPGSAFGPGQEDYLRIAFGNVGADRMPDLAARLVASQDPAG